MKKAMPSCVLLLLACAPLRAKDPPATVKETWDAVYPEGAKIGWFHTTVTEGGKGGDKTLITDVSMELTIRRYDSVVTLRLDTMTEEAPDGNVVDLGHTED